MQRDKAPGRFAAFGVNGAASSLLILLCAPALAANVLCDRAAPDADSLDIPVADLSISVVDHGLANSIAAGVPDAEDATAAPTVVSLKPRVSTILRQIFDETAPAGQESLDATPATSASAASLAELTTPAVSDPAKQPPALDTDGDADSDLREQAAAPVEANLSPPAADHVLRYRRQMYRTDI